MPTTLRAVPDGARGEGGFSLVTMPATVTHDDAPRLAAIGRSAATPGSSSRAPFAFPIAWQYGITIDASMVGSPATSNPSVNVSDSSTSGTGVFAIDCTQTLSSLTASSGEVDVGAALTITTVMTIAGTLTLGALTLQSGSTVTDNVQAAAMVLATIDGQLTINSDTTVNFVEQGGDVLAVYQELFQYNSIATGSFDNLTLGTGPVAAPSKVNDVPNASVDLAFGTPLFWTGGSGTWNRSSTNSHWSDSPDGTNPVAWSDNDIAVIAGGGGASTITLQDSDTKQPAAIVFLSDGYTIADSGGGNPGQLTIAQSRVLTDRYWKATIAAKVACPTTLITSGAGTTELTHQDNLQSGLAVQEGTTVIAFSNVLPDGTALYVGDVSAFGAAALPAGGQMLAGAAAVPSGTTLATGASTSPSAGSRSTSQPR